MHADLPPLVLGHNGRSSKNDKEVSIGLELRYKSPIYMTSLRLEGVHLGTYANATQTQRKRNANATHTQNGAIPCNETTEHVGWDKLFVKVFSL